ncbi:cell wall alpha-1,3-glucan synthase mok11 [Coccidioides immitis RMSCC 3703]|uniref:alpha-1,3-glucan synthase n=1 Tax=Coccidioides immitis RMSCC 3703 TaxID=454286 RepID=A0A0J8QMP0_COCIT|nr:cell wall alpha-1,3-glucan synthase mok11 [Coccidioides immitis RMSCC 3703]
MVFTRAANYSRTLLHRNEKGHLYVAHHAAGADSYRYSTNWGSTWSDWLPYKGGNDTLNKQGWSGTKKQQWIGEHVIVEYWNRMVGSSSHMQHGDVDWESDHPRRFPHLFWNGPYNQYGYDAGVRNQMQFNDNGQWAIRFMTEWPALAQVNVWGMNADGNPDKTYVFGDSDGNSVLDRLPPSSLKNALVNITEHPPSPYLSWEFLLDDGTLYFELVPRGSMYQQMALFFLLLILPLATAGGSLYAFKCYFCRITFNNKGSVGGGQGLLLLPGSNDYESSGLLRTLADKCNLFPRSKELGFSANTRRTVLIATMEYDIMDWEIKIKIGGLGVMAQLMGHRLGHVNLVWVVPCVEDVSYPIDQKAQPMIVKSLGKDCIVGVQYHIMKNITYILLDAPIFRKQKKNDPYPPRMDDLESAIYYSIWNQCIAQIMRRFQIDIYHINDYHGALAPLYILPKTVPVCLSLHNAEFQGRWQIRSDDDMTELCSVFNISEDITRRYIQFGEVFNLLHAAASYLRIHQGGFGIVGVSEKYAERSYKRYPIFWGLKAVGKLPNPDPQDDNEVVELDPRFESIKAQLKRESQKWLVLTRTPTPICLSLSEGGRTKKEFDLIAGVLSPSFLEAPTGRAAYLDEPFGLVAVEFGRKGVIGIGAKVGGLGKMPGWWYSVESTATRHLLHQFERAINQALRARPEVHAKIRARSITQRFPVSQWVERLDMLHINAMRIHERYRNPTTPKAQNPKDQRRRTQSDFQNTDHPEADLLNSLHPVFPPSDRLVGLRSGHTVSLEWLVGNRTDFCLQNVDPSFDDQNGKFTEEFMMKLELLNGNNSMKSLCIEEFIVKSQRQWYKKLSNAFLGRAKDTIPLEKSTVEDLLTLPPALSEDLESGSIEDSKGGKSATGLKRMMLYRVGYWPVYSFFLAFGQIIAVNSYQIMLLTGEIGEAAKKLYAIASIYLLGSILWWLMFRKFELATTLSSPFAAYSFAFLVVGFAQIWYAKGRLLQNIAAGVYSFASASGSVFFALNFNDEAGSQVRDWVFRACIIQGTQQIFVVALWYWVSKLSKSMAEGMNQTERLGSWQIHGTRTNTEAMRSIVFPVACVLGAIGVIVYLGLPDCYRGRSGKIPSFYTSVFRRNIINFFLSPPYGRNWWCESRRPPDAIAWSIMFG